ncbi:hypothetical protein [Microbacterium halophytorum]|uniref:hypothetical protein n=1 Tax=Microbacterium halophytorum TaxID=2067568 RepID=UPI001319BF85|nr:hypothetical protein [Microbacterium halophytorum]
MTSIAPSRPSLALCPCPVPLIRRTANGTRFDHALRRGDLRRIRSGIYTRADAWDSLPPWERYLARVHAFALKRPHAVLTNESAAALWGLPLVGSQPHVHAIAPRSGDARLTGDVQWHHLVDRLEVVTAQRATVTDPIETVVNLARCRHPAVARVAADALLRIGDCTSDALLHANEARSSKRGRAAARWPLSTATPTPESAFETLSLLVIEWLGFETPDLQISIRAADGAEYRVDFFWRRCGIIGEADGRAKYVMDGRAAEEAVWAEKLREDALRGSAAGFVRWTWDAIRRPEQLEQILRGAGLSEVRAPQRELLRMLAAIL